MTAYTAAELMVTAAARKIRNGEIVFVGMRLPLLGFLLAKCTHAPEAVGIYELGIIRDSPSPEPILTMGDLPNLYQAGWLADTGDAMALLQQGGVDVSFIGGAQVDRYGNLNTTRILSENNSYLRLPGSGGACDLACLARQHIIIMAHEKRRFVPRVDYITSPGFGTGPGWRQQQGLPRGGPAGVITTLACFSFDPKTGEMVLDSIHPDTDMETVQSRTGWPITASEPLGTTPAPTREELDILRRFDPEGYWTGPRRETIT